ncbi:MAG: serine/threonine protein kinase [Gemmatimonadetes bacterium]|nr:serine/threonine protein kinase [Gemmatimonadota bacterium]
MSRQGQSIPAMVEDIEARLAKELEGRYELRGLLGHGGMGAVFLALEVSLDRLVAIKVLPPSLSLEEEVLARFTREARTAARLDHRGIVPIYSVEESGGLHFYVMKFIAGHDLGDEIPDGGMDWERARELLWESAVALGHAHGRGVIHRDVKPANIMINQAGDALVTDFGIAKAVRSGTQMTSTGQMIGTPQYMSPEQMEGKDLDGRADQYSLGMVAWHMLTGRRPWDAGSVASILVKQISEYPESLAVLRPEVPDAVVGTIERAIRKDPEERFPSMEEFAQALWPERAGGVVVPRATSSRRRDPAAASASRGPKKAWIAAAAVIVLAGGAFVGQQVMSGGVDPGEREALDGATPGEGIDPDAQVAGGSQLVDGGATSGDVGEEEASPQGGGASVGGGAPAGATVAGAGSVPQQPTAPTTAPPASATQPPSTGFLTIGTGGTYAFVEVNGIELDLSTPLFEHELPPGTHVVTLRREGYVTVVDTVEITAGNVTRRNHVMIRN